MHQFIFPISLVNRGAKVAGGILLFAFHGAGGYLSDCSMSREDPLIGQPVMQLPKIFCLTDERFFLC